MSGSGSGCSTVVCRPLVKHDVFLSFRGEDTRDSFISHLYAELVRKNIDTFIDYKLGKGQEISPALHQAIQESLLYVIVFSQDYASSTWCLDELTHMLECRKRHGRDMIPVFYEVDPSTVRYLRGRYAEAFENHEKRFEEKVHAWKAALTQAAGLSGWDSQVTRPEETLVAEIVKDILKKLNRSSRIDHQGIIGIEGHLSRIQSLLHVESPAPRIIGIWGMGGIGKTTIANQIYHKFAVQFGSSSVILNTEEEIGRHGMQHIRCKYISDILEEDIKPSGLSFAYERLKRAKVLLILDDVNNSGQLKDLIGGHSRFGPGSRIILTSRDLQVLKNAGADEIYEVKELNPEDSLKLFCLHAFKQIRPKETYRGLSEKILNYVNGIPLALEVLGSLLYDRTEEEWESELQKLRKLPNPEILNILKLSYDRLDDEQKDIFLDIACFYRGQWENVVAQTLNIFGFSAKIGINVLKERCLISISKGRVVMHCLIGEMGQEIVRKECVHNPGKRSRLWKVGDIDHVLRRNKGTDKIQCILLDICKIKEVQLHAKTFEKMDNLRMLQFYKSYFVNLNESNVFRSSIGSLPDSLKVLHWDDFPRRSLPLNFFPENLVRLVMHQCQLEQWEQDQHLPNLKRLDLSNSWKLTEIPDLCLSPNIEEIILSNCVKVVEVYSTCFLSKLNRLCLDGCVELDTVYMQCNILSTSSGEILLYNCRKLQSFSISKTEVPPPHLGRSRPPPPKATGVYSHVLDNASFKSLPCYDRFEEVENDLNHEVYYKLLREVVSSTFPTLYELCWLDLSNCESLTARGDQNN